jgi:transposase
VENAVQQVERWVLAPLRNQTFFSRTELNAAIWGRLEWLNGRPFSRLEGSRRSLWMEIDRPALLPLPQRRFEIADWKCGVGVNIDYHFEFDRHIYSVPHTLVGKRIDVRATSTMIEAFHKGQRIASHRKGLKLGGFTTDPSHRPKSHQRYAEWSPSRLIRWGETIGPETGAVIAHILKTKPHPEQGYRSCLGILRLAKRYSSARLENAAKRARSISSVTYRSISSILKNDLDKKPIPDPQGSLNLSPPLDHENLRGPNYYE